MSGREKRTPISIYLTPRASTILREYNMGSGYGSLSRTVEEIILAFDSAYKATKDALKSLAVESSKSGKSFTNQQKTVFFLSLYMTLTNIDNAISRLNREQQLIP